MIAKSKPVKLIIATKLNPNKQINDLRKQTSMPVIHKLIMAINKK